MSDEPEAVGDHPGQRDAIRQELERLEESAMYSAQIQFEAAKQWRGINLILGLPASILAAVAGATVLADVASSTVVGALALSSAALGGVLTTVNASHRMNQASAAANAYLEIQTAARQARTVDLDYIPVEEARSTLTELTARRDEQNKTVEPPNRRSYKRGSRNISAGGQSYATDQARNPDAQEGQQ